MTTIDFDTLVSVTGGNDFNARTAFDALSNAYANGNNQNIMGGVTDDGKYEMRMRSDTGSGIACTRTMGERPTYACRTFTGE